MILGYIIIFLVGNNNKIQKKPLVNFLNVKKWIIYNFV